MRKRFRVFCVILFGLTGCSPQSFFYYPNRVLYSDPAKHGIAYKLVEYKSLNGKTLYGVLFQTKEKPIGIVVFFHGNYGNVSNHYSQCEFLEQHGFDVLIFDYEGYGGSEGHPTPKTTVEDGIATVHYARDHGRSALKNVAVFGQSLGGAIALLVAAKETWIKGAVIESTFTSYRAQARYVLGRHIWTWPLYPVFPLFLGSSNDPIRFVASISPRPVLLIHGDKDTIVPVSMSRKLFEAAKEPKKLWIIPGAGHLSCRFVAGKEYEREIVDFLTKAMES